MSYQHELKPALLLKRTFDLLLSGCGLIVLSPIMLLIALVIRITHGNPVLFSHVRPGIQGKPFTLCKFRTMSNRSDPAGNPLPDQERLFPLGQFLRSTSLDELPELLNVFKGEMSLVGPRPLLMQYLTRYNSHQARRLEVKPGITGWAQINGRNALSWEQKLNLDVWYVDHWSLWLDIRILFLTFFKIIKREGISAEGHATMPEFMGESQRNDNEKV